MLIRRDDQVVLRKAVTGAKHLDGRAVGKEAKGTVARVLKVIPKTNRIVVEGVKYVYKHVRRSQTNPRGGRVAKEAAIDASNVMLYCHKCGGPARVGRKFNRKTSAQGKTHREVLRICKRCGETLGSK